jgi:hypothetical protein
VALALYRDRLKESEYIMRRFLGRFATVMASTVIALALMCTSTTAHAATAEPRKDRHTMTVGVTGWTWSNGAYVGVKFSRTKTEYLYNGVIGEGVFAGVSAVCGSLARAPYGVVIAPTCAAVMTAKYTQVKNALADAHNDEKCVEFRHWPAGFNPFAKSAVSVKCTYNDQ